MEYTNKFPTAIQSPGSNLDNHFGSYLQSERPRKLIRGCNYFIHWAGNFKGKFQKISKEISNLLAGLLFIRCQLDHWLRPHLALAEQNSASISGKFLLLSM
jgi:hypothetical protein